MALGRGGEEFARNLRFGAFDILIKNGERFQYPGPMKADKALAELLPTSGRLHRVPRQLLDKAAVRERFRREVVKGDQEGLICQSDDGLVYKIKNRQYLDAVVVGFTEAQPDPDKGLAAGMVGSLLTALLRPDGSLQLLTEVGSGLTNALRRDLFHMLSADLAESMFKATDENHNLFQMVRPSVVIEIGFLDVVSETPRGRPVRRTVLEFDAEAGFFPHLPERFVTVVFPTFHRLRDDKQATPSDLRLTQLAAFTDLDNLEANARSIQLPESEILRREVYVKTFREQFMVRKFVSWRTNKAELDDSFPAYVFCFVDYSPNRRSPLCRTLRCAPDAAGIIAIHERFVENEVKKGWQLQQ